MQPIPKGRQCRLVWFWLVVASLLAPDPAVAVVKELANDGFTGSGALACQPGFVAGESAAATLTAEPGDYPYVVRKVRMLICPASTSANVILRISEDNSGTPVPGPMIYEELFQVTGSVTALNEFDLTAQNIVIPSGSVRVEIEWVVIDGAGIANDIDGFVPNVNTIFAIPPGAWFWAYVFGVTGDWIIRLEIETGAETPIFSDNFESGTSAAWSATVP